MSKAQEVSLWAGLAAAFGSILAVGAFDLLNIDGFAEFFISVIVGLFTGGAIYTQQRLAFAKQRENGETPPVKPTTSTRRNT